MTQVTLSVIGLLIYWPVAVFIGHAETDTAFDPTTEAVVCHSLHPWPKPGGVWDICEILLDQRMTITPPGIHMPPTASFEGLATSCHQVSLENTGALGLTHTHMWTEHQRSVHTFPFQSVTNDAWKWGKTPKVIKYSKSSGLCCSTASAYKFWLEVALFLSIIS